MKRNCNVTNITYDSWKRDYQFSEGNSFSGDETDEKILCVFN